MKCSECKNYSVQDKVVKKEAEKGDGGICRVDNTVCNSEDECKTGLFDKLGAM